MISRRNIRIKVMQALYALEAADSPADKVTEKTVQSGIKALNKKISDSADLFALLLAFVCKVAQYAETDAHNRSAKYLPSAEDLAVSTKIAGNTFLWELLENNTFQEKIKEARSEERIDKEWVKKIYRQLAASETYKAYVAAAGRDPQTEKKIIQQIWDEEMMGNERFLEYLSEEWAAWEDDKRMMYMLMENFFKKHKNINFLQFISPEKREFAVSLLETAVLKQDYAMEMIRPKLKNWDPERVAIIDLVLLKMGLCELLYFPTIPTKVTINEYIEIAKLYSTPQSGQFVNGVLDNLLKDLSLQGKIEKTERSK